MNCKIPIIDYLLHNKAYRMRKQKGFPGWDSKEDTEKSIRAMEGLCAMISLPKRATVLDLGCGAGNLSFWLESKGYEVYAADVAAEAIDWARDEAKKRGSSVRFTVSDASGTMPYANESFHLIMDNHALHCIIGKDRAGYLQNIYKYLKPGTHYIVSTMSYEGDGNDAPPGFDPHSRCIVRGKVATRYLGTAKSILTEIASAGFSILHNRVERDNEGNAELFVIAQKPHIN